MLLTDGGVDQFTLWRNRLVTRFDELRNGHHRFDVESYQAAWDVEDAEDTLVLNDPTPQANLLRFRSLLQNPSTEADMTGHERRARVLALRGLSQARDGEYARAQTSFASAARLDPMLDLALLPTFWSLSRHAHEAAVAALREAGRTRDAAALTATIRTRFRPRAIRAINRTDSEPGD